VHLEVTRFYLVLEYQRSQQLVAEVVVIVMVAAMMEGLAVEQPKEVAASALLVKEMMVVLQEIIIDLRVAEVLVLLELSLMVAMAHLFILHGALQLLAVKTFLELIILLVAALVLTQAQLAVKVAAETL
jgi:hypothetical protein